MKYIAPVPTSTPTPPPPGTACANPANGYEGFGNASGGAGKNIYRVTNLNDSGTGSLRDAVAQSSRCVIFDVSGVINLSSDISIMGSFVTIDGFTAPFAGITLNNGGLRIRGGNGAHDVIVRGIRVRNAPGDGFNIANGAYKVAVDHVSVSNSGDGNIDITQPGTRDVTVSWSILANAGLDTGGGEKNMLLADRSTRMTLHHNLFTKSSSRNPQLSYDDTTDPVSAKIVDADTSLDMRNNVITEGVTRVRNGGRANIVNNYYFGGSGSIEILSPGGAHTSGNVSKSGVNLNIGSIQTALTAPAIATTDAVSAACAVFAGAGVRPLDSIDNGNLSQISLACGPVPSPTPTPISAKFSLGDKVKVIQNVNVRQTAGGTLFGVQYTGSLGTVIGGPQYAILPSNGQYYQWWNINFDNAPDGWSGEDYLEKYSDVSPQTPSVKITYPVANSTLTSKNTAVEGTCSNYSGTVDVFYYSDKKEETFVQCVSGKWSIPNLSINSNAGSGSFDLYAIVYPPTSVSVQDIIKLYFNWSDAPSITVISPNGGESWAMNSSQTIKWVSHGTHVTISLVSLDKTKEVYGLLGSIPNDGSETMWLPSDLPLGQYYLRVRCVGNCTSSAQQYDDSDAPFSIVAQIAPTPTINAIASYISGTIDKVGNTGGINTDAPDGINDEHILLGGVSGTISKVRIAGSSGGIWETPYNGSNWIVGLRPQSDPSKVDLYFNFWRQASSYTVSITFSNGATQTIPVSVPVVQPTPTPPSGVSVTLNLVGNPATGPYTLEAQTSVAGDIKVEFWVDGNLYRTENFYPYTLFGDNGSSFFTGTLGQGSHTVSAKVYGQNSSTLLAEASTAINDGNISFLVPSKSALAIVFDQVDELKFIFERLKFLLR
ncbi:hypothetical protein A2930_01970 [Candidatus Giovannonibacteria bacterium RIFCSPLOWO2_01_FULL_45_34]|uniref:Pectate lyase domain-containing protein n=1 Tax=Candidatus Giovannonibacteria bacterium RIFCSPLOWO2_01_FULL_45_34 TaxID=1798351 RepID=A0A1F5X2R9_9BACT|nr:MAG: hypothetical protein A2930_01970 [Candidatus Giovannonibacteria bacterium RIFCSPLOWO2_01_FULL_45_34]